MLYKNGASWAGDSKIFNNCMEKKSRRRDGSGWGTKKNGWSRQWRRDHRYKFVFGSSILRHIVESELAET